MKLQQVNNVPKLADERCEKLGTNHNLNSFMKEQNIIPVKKTLNAGHIDAKIESILAKFAQKKSSEIGCFLLIVSWRSFLPKFPVKLADFSKNLPLKILQNLNFSAKILRNFDFFSVKYQKPCLCTLNNNFLFLAKGFNNLELVNVAANQGKLTLL